MKGYTLTIMTLRKQNKNTNINKRTEKNDRGRQSEKGSCLPALPFKTHFFLRKSMPTYMAIIITLATKL